MVLVVFSMTTAASEEMSEAWGHPEMELVDMYLMLQLLHSGLPLQQIWEPGKEEMQKDQEPEKLRLSFAFS